MSAQVKSQPSDDEDKIKAEQIQELAMLRERLAQMGTIEEALRQSEARLEMFFAQSLDGFFFMMLDEPVQWDGSVDKENALDYIFAHQRVTKVNDALLTQYRAAKEDYIGLTPNDFFAHDLVRGRKVWRDFFDQGHLHVYTNERKFDGTPMWVEGDYICMYDAEGRITGHFGIQRDVTERVEVEQALRRSEAQYHALFEQNPYGVVILDPCTTSPIEFNNQVCHQLGYIPEEFAKLSLPDIDVIETLEDGLRRIEEIMQKGRASYETQQYTKQGEIRDVHVIAQAIDVGGIPIFHCIWHDITERKRNEKLLEKTNEELREYVAEIERLHLELKEQALRDPLTGLYNRRHLVEALGHEYAHIQRTGQPLSMIIMDVDYFKEVNDAYGHQAGDDFLKALADLILSHTRKSDIACRFGGEEFLLVMPGATLESAIARAETLRTECTKIYVPTPKEFSKVTVSCGIATYPVHANSLNDTLLKADKALYQSKAKGRNSITVWRE